MVEVSRAISMDEGPIMEVPKKDRDANASAHGIEQRCSSPSLKGVVHLDEPDSEPFGKKFTLRLSSLIWLGGEKIFKVETLAEPSSVSWFDLTASFRLYKRKILETVISQTESKEIMVRARGLSYSVAEMLITFLTIFPVTAGLGETRSWSMLKGVQPLARGIHEKFVTPLPTEVNAGDEGVRTLYIPITPSPTPSKEVHIQISIPSAHTTLLASAIFYTPSQKTCTKAADACLTTGEITCGENRTW
ncbi:hypothetical protein B9Z19DRAFT_1120370 [Tuber borchii]|uniref:Uncharacterized protein n=1 Tax=Tuber borchii TaxID=42251 RepID=A0A2T7A4F7_TUBBO|nr:hypothetical protein B9Z19DRAFT_1120370 [Tuber borchii]